MAYIIGYMQGRLSPLVDGKIQAFPWDHWQDEFPVAQRLGLRAMEWTLDQDRLYENPLMTAAGRARIRELSAAHGVAIRSLTGDCFMQAPFYKASGSRRAALLRDLGAIVDACAELGVRDIVFPLVDNGSIENAAQEEDLRLGLMPLMRPLADRGMRIVFESDYAPREVVRFITTLPQAVFGINYDIGNSAALGYDPQEEIASYGQRIYHVHVKDRVRGGTTVPLGTGNADFPAVFGALRRSGYGGDFVLQTARAADGDHAGALARYRDCVAHWWDDATRA